MIIPPSIPYILFSMASCVSVGCLFKAGIVPGILIEVLLMAYENLITTPILLPIGVNLFVASSLSGIPVMNIAKKAFPLIMIFLVALLLITFDGKRIQVWLSFLGNCMSSRRLLWKHLRKQPPMRGSRQISEWLTG